MPVAIPRPASTVAVVRDAAAGLEVLLLQRAERGDHNSGAWVFPGGLVDAGDHETPCDALDDDAASRVLGLSRGGRAAYVAALRECFEEAGLLFAVDATGRFAAFEGEAAARLPALRASLKAGDTTLAALCREFDLRLAPERLHYVAHWITPAGRAKRFDTRFFVAVLPAGQVSAQDDDETLDQVWIAPHQALAPENTRRLMTPTRAVLKLLSRFDNCTALIEWAGQPREVRTVLPRLASTGAELTPVLPEHPAWHEAGLLDPEGRGHVQVKLQPGVAVRLSDRLVRVTAADGETNGYLVARGDGWVAIPAPGGSEADRQALLAAAEGPVREVLATDAQLLLADDRMLVGGAVAPPGTAADWHAPSRGFLRPLVHPGDRP